MKFQQLNIGQQFEYQGDIYVKSSPLVASHATTGVQKLIPRYAAIVVTPTPPDKRPARNLNSQQVQVAFDKFYDCFLVSLQKLEPVIESHTRESFQDEMDNARQLFLTELRLQN